jgi:hypothetical protein
VPKQHSSAGKDKLGSISKQGDRYLRSLFTAGALAVIRFAKISMVLLTTLARGTLGAPADQGPSDCAHQQARADGVGHDAQGRTLQGTRRAGGVNEIAPDVRRDVKVGRANST